MGQSPTCSPPGVRKFDSAFLTYRLAMVFPTGEWHLKPNQHCDPSTRCRMIGATFRKDRKLSAEHIARPAWPGLPGGLNTSKCSKNFDRRPHRRFVTPCGGEWIRPSNAWFLLVTWVSPRNGISIGLAVFAGLTNVTNEQTDHATPRVAIGR